MHIEKAHIYINVKPDPLYITGNVALYKNTTQATSAVNGFHMASNAVDGNHDRVESCSRAMGHLQTAASWMVDLGADYVIYNITITTRNINAGTASSHRINWTPLTPLQAMILHAAIFGAGICHTLSIRLKYHGQDSTILTLSVELWIPCWILIAGRLSVSAFPVFCSNEIGYTFIQPFHYQTRVLENLHWVHFDQTRLAAISRWRQMDLILVNMKKNIFPLISIIILPEGLTCITL